MASGHMSEDNTITVNKRRLSPHQTSWWSFLTWAKEDKELETTAPGKVFFTQISPEYVSPLFSAYLVDLDLPLLPVNLWDRVPQEDR